MKPFAVFSLLTTAATYVLVFVGGLVRVAGAGLGCPDWPKCFGRWWPPTHVSQLPADIDPAAFNIVLAWIEYVNRLTGVFVGILILAAFALAWHHHRDDRRIMIGAGVAVVMVIFEGWLGAKVVSSQLAPTVVSLHMVAAMLLVSVLIYVTLCSLEGPRPDTAGASPRGLYRWLLGVWALAIAQIFFGAEMRADLESLAQVQPLASDHQLYLQLGITKWLHFVSAGAMTLAIARLLPLARRCSSGLAFGIYLCFALVLVEVGLGLLMGQIGLAPLARVFHLWIGSLLTGITMVMYFCARPSKVSPQLARDAVVGLTGAGAASGLLLILVALGVIYQAAASRAAIDRFQPAPVFQFVDQHGNPFGSDAFAGKFTIVNFFFCRCPGICPAMNTKLAALYELYRGDDRVQFVSISVQPEVDLVDVLREYAADYGVDDLRWRFLNGPKSEVEELCRSGFAVSADLPMFHTPKFILIDASAIIRGYYDSNSDAAIAQLKSHIRELATQPTGGDG